MLLKNKLQTFVLRVSFDMELNLQKNFIHMSSKLENFFVSTRERISFEKKKMSPRDCVFPFQPSFVTRLFFSVDIFFFVPRHLFSLLSSIFFVMPFQVEKPKLSFRRKTLIENSPHNKSNIQITLYFETVKHKYIFFLHNNSYHVGVIYV